MHIRPITPNNLPLPFEAFLSLFDAISAQLEEHECDNTLGGTIGWLMDHGYDVATVTGWLSRRGGYCDCEVLLNVEPKVCGEE